MSMVALMTALIAAASFGQTPDDLFVMRENADTRWASGENPLALKGEGGKANDGAKGAAFQKVPAGETVTLMETDGSGVIHRMWCTVSERDPQMLRALRLEMYWDGAEKPAVSVPLGDFFGMVHGKMVAFENGLFSSPEGRSFNFAVPMPFRKGARVTLTNDGNRDLQKLFYDINFTLEPVADKALYFHANWRRERWTTLGKDFQILPKVAGQGRFLGVHLGIIEHPNNVGWWGEGEVKVYLDGDGEFPTLVGTGTEDYIGTGWGQGEFKHVYQGCLIADNENGVQAFYRYHVPDPVYFHEDIRVTIQQMGGAAKSAVLKLLEEGVEVRPVSINYGDQDQGDVFIPLFEAEEPIDLASHESPKGAWVNMYRRDDVCATAFFYLDSPANDLPPLADLGNRLEALPE